MVDELGADDAEMQEAGLTLRQKLAAHAEKSVCAGCHSRIDPLGFPFDGYDDAGLPREDHDGFSIDTAGRIEKFKSKFGSSGYASLKKGKKAAAPAEAPAG